MAFTRFTLIISKQVESLLKSNFLPLLYKNHTELVWFLYLTWLPVLAIIGSSLF